MGLVLADTQGLTTGFMTVERAHMLALITPTTSWADCLQTGTIDLMDHWHQLQMPDSGNQEGKVLHAGTSARFFWLVEALAIWDTDREFIVDLSTPDSDEEQPVVITPASKVIDAFKGLLEDVNSIYKAERKDFAMKEDISKFTTKVTFQRYSVIHPKAQPELVQALRYVSKKEAILPGMARLHYCLLAFFSDPGTTDIILEKSPVKIGCKRGASKIQSLLCREGIPKGLKASLAQNIRQSARIYSFL